MSYKIAVIGMGYVGLPLAVEFGKKYDVLGYDINADRINELKSGIDKTLEVNSEELKEAKKLKFTDKLNELKDYNIYIVTVPTPIDKHKIPDLSPLKSASEMVGKIISKGDIVIYESTVYPGCTEEFCVPIIEKVSGLKFNLDFFVGYSPERINPGDKEHRFYNIKKITSGSTPEIAKKIDELYNSVIKVGTYMASSLMVAEAAKVIENAQRDLNIAFVNELSILFSKLGIDTLEVLEAAGTKWNFLPFRPGLVGGHCIGVDPYYLTYKAKEIGHHPEVILAGRRVNDNMGFFIANQVIKLLIKKGHVIKGSRILIMGITFKENCPDIRNTRVIDIINELKEFQCSVDVYDPLADNDEVKEEYGISLIDKFEINNYDGIVFAVAHNEFKKLDQLISNRKKNQVVYDVKGIFQKELVDSRL